MNQKSKNTVKNYWDCVGIFTRVCDCVSMSACVRVRVCVCVCGGVIVAHYYVCMSEWHIVHVYVKVHAQRVVFTGC